MKKILLTAVIAAALLSCSVLNVAYAAETDTGTYEAWLGEQIPRTPQTGGVWQSNAAANAGCSSVRYGLETGGGENKFIRFANFDGRYDVAYTSACATIGKAAGNITVSFCYRLYEGADSYLESDGVFAVSAGGVQKTLHFSELTANKQGDYSWRSASVNLAVPSDANADRVTLTYYYGAGARYADNFRCMDLDNLIIESGSILNSDGEFDNAAVSSSGEKIADIDYAANALSEKEQYMLGAGEILNYSQNNTYTHTAFTAFNGGKITFMLARSGNSGTYRGAASTNAGESDNYAVYDEAEQNTYLRFANFNGSEGVNSTRIVMYFYDNVNGGSGNIPQTNKLRYSFDYRLYIDDVARAGMTLDDPVFRFDTRSSSHNNSGYIPLRELTVNEEGDGTWQTYNGVLETTLSTTAYINFYYYGSYEAAFDTKTYADIDNIYLSDVAGGTNYAHLNGTFEGFIPEDYADDPLNAAVGYNPVLGGRAQKYALSSTDYRMKLNAGDTFNLRLNWQPETNVYYTSFNVKGDDNAVIKLYFSGRSGQAVTLECGKNQTLDGGAVRTEWKREGDGWKCGVFYAGKNAVMYTLDFVNAGGSAVLIDDVFIGQVASVCNAAGDYSAFGSGLAALREQFEKSKESYSAQALSEINKAFARAESIDGFSSAARMDKALEAIRSCMDGVRKADLTEIEKTIARAENIIYEKGSSAYEKSGWLVFKDALSKARNVGENNTQEEVDALNEALLSAIDGLKGVAPPSDRTLTIGLAAGAGVAGAGGIAAGACLIKRRKKQCV